MKRILKLLLAASFAMFAYTAGAQTLDNTWPPTDETKELLKQKIDIIKGLPDSVIKSNPGIFIDDVGVMDERNVYVIDGYLFGYEIYTSYTDADNPRGNGVGKPYTDLYVVNDKGETVLALNTGRWSRAFWILSDESMKVSEGVYRVRASYGKKHDKNGTKPSQLVNVRLKPYVIGATH